MSAAEKAAGRAWAAASAGDPPDDADALVALCLEELQQLANWWADTLVANEVAWADGVPLPVEFQRMVARRMVANPELGWPDVPSALDTLRDLYEAPVRTNDG